MRKLWGRSGSANVQKVAWLLEELGLNAERIIVGGRFGKNTTPEYRALNPNGLVPTLEDEGHVLWESNTILRYLDSRYDGGLLPDAPAARALCERWMDWQLATLSPAMKPVYMPLVRATDDPQTPAKVAAARPKLDAAMGILNAQLAATAYVGGSSFSLGDIPVGIQAYRWFTLPIERPSFPALADWYARLCQRPAFRQHVTAVPLE